MTGLNNVSKPREICNDVFNLVACRCDIRGKVQMTRQRVRKEVGER